MADLSRSEDRRKRRPADHASPVSFEAMFRYPPVFSALPRLAVAASLLGFDPSQRCSCPQAAAMFPCRRSHLPFPERPFPAGGFL
jgi:hypothetical protein